MQVYDQFEIESKGEILGFKCFKKHFDQKLHSDVSKKYRQPKSPSTVPPPRNFSYQFGSSLFHLKKSRRSSGVKKCLNPPAEFSRKEIDECDDYRMNKYDKILKTSLKEYEAKHVHECYMWRREHPDYTIYDIPEFCKLTEKLEREAACKESKLNCVNNFLEGKK